MSERWVIHALLVCQDCGWEPEKHATAQAAASSHASRKGHKVTGEVAYAVECGDRTRTEDT